MDQFFCFFTAGSCSNDQVYRGRLRSNGAEVAVKAGGSGRWNGETWQSLRVENLWLGPATWAEGLICVGLDQSDNFYPGNWILKLGQNFKGVSQEPNEAWGISCILGRLILRSHRYIAKKNRRWVKHPVSWKAIPFLDLRTPWFWTCSFFGGRQSKCFVTNPLRFIIHISWIL